MLLQEEREKIVEYGQEMLKRGLTAGTFGNLRHLQRGRGEPVCHQSERYGLF